MKDRYSRQIVYLGEENQEKISKSRICVVGCGALGSVVASMLSRAGANLIIIDRDFVEKSNLQRAVLFNEDDINKPKAIAAKERLKRINSEIDIEILVDDLDPDNISKIKSDVVIDCTDNIHTRHMINEFCVQNRIPWVYGAVIGTDGMAAFFTKQPCFRCMLPRKVERGQLDTCETHGILSPTVHMIASWQVMQAIKIITNKPDCGVLFNFSLENGRFETSRIKEDPDCKVCIKNEYSHLEKIEEVVKLCGRNAYQIKAEGEIDLEELGSSLKKNPDYDVISSKNILHIKHKNKRLSLFSNRRAIIYAESEDEAKNFYNMLLPK